MDPFAPINGISLERYADLGAALDGIDKDKAKKEEVLRSEGVTVADYDAAVAGWTARMQDMSLMGKVATAFITAEGDARRTAPRRSFSPTAANPKAWSPR